MFSCLLLKPATAAPTTCEKPLDPLSTIKTKFLLPICPGPSACKRYLPSCQLVQYFLSSAGNISSKYFQYFSLAEIFPRKTFNISLWLKYLLMGGLSGGLNSLRLALHHSWPHWQSMGSGDSACSTSCTMRNTINTTIQQCHSYEGPLTQITDTTP